MTQHVPGDPDVVIIGAGAAGLAAAQALMDAGKSVAVLEAGAAVGGRCFAETETFGVPFDRGGAWMHSAAINPLVPLAERAGFTIHKQEWAYGTVHTGERNLTEPEVSEYDAYLDSMWSAVDAPGPAGRDVALADLLPEGRWRDVARHWIAQYDARDADQIASGDRAAYEDAEGDWLLAEGLGTLIARLGSRVPVQLNCPVTAVDWSGKRIAVATPQGKIETDRVVLTVSTGVLAAERIAFTPQLPAAKLSAISDLPTGLLNKVGFLFDGTREDIPEGYLADYHAGGEQFFSILFGFCGTNLAVAFLAGRFGQEMEAQGKGAGTEFCLEGLRAMFGSGITKHIIKTDETAWMGNPLTLGSYSAAQPGRAHVRQVLAEPVNGRLFFAGEATIPRAYATVHGARLSGIDAANAILSLGA